MDLQDVLFDLYTRLTRSVDIVTDLLDAVEKTIRAWKRFNDGDHILFQDPQLFQEQSPFKCREMLGSIKKNYEGFEDLHDSLSRLKDGCLQDAKRVSVSSSC